MNVNGTATDSTTIESTSVVSPSITGDASILYIVYGKNNEVTAKYSTDGGGNWSYIGSNPPNSNASWIESVISNGILHVTYQVSNSSLYRNFASNAWSEQYTVSSGENGIYPRITAWQDANNDKIYFMYKKLNTSDIKWREFNVATESWTSDPQLAFSIFGSSPAGIAVTDTRITFYYNFYIEPYWYIQWIIKDKSNNYIVTCLEYLPDKVSPRVLYSTRTSNDNVHVPIWLNMYSPEEEPMPGIYHSNGYNCTLNEIYWNIYQEDQNIKFINCSSSSNDVYVIWNDSDIGPNLRLIYDDQNPLAPSGLAVNPYQQGNTLYAKLTWQLNNEPAVFIKASHAYEIHRRIYKWGNPWTTWTLVASPGGDETEFIDYEVQGEGAAEVYIAEYKMKAVDYDDHYSDFSSTVSIDFQEYSPNSPLRGGSNSLAKTTETGDNNLNSIYNLDQNFPNPFNPTTTISYSIKSAGLVTLKVYDMLGTEVASLVNENKDAGNYSVEFNASDLPSGMYVYRLSTANFIDTKKLILLK